MRAQWDRKVPVPTRIMKMELVAVDVTLDNPNKVFREATYHKVCYVEPASLAASLILHAMVTLALAHIMTRMRYPIMKLMNSYIL